MGNRKPSKSILLFKQNNRSFFFFIKAFIRDYCGVARAHTAEIIVITNPVNKKKGPLLYNRIAE